jgi:hypothetical protein
VRQNRLVAITKAVWIADRRARTSFEADGTSQAAAAAVRGPRRDPYVQYMDA